MALSKPVALSGVVALGAAACFLSIDMSLVDSAPDGGGSDALAESAPGDDGPSGSSPSYCTGILFYARYDGTLTSQEGTPVASPAPK